MSQAGLYSRATGTEADSLIAPYKGYVIIALKKGGISMVAVKQASIETIKRLPDECSVEDIMYEINFVAQVLDGLKDAEEGRLLTTEQLLRRVERWEK